MIEDKIEGDVTFSYEAARALARALNGVYEEGKKDKAR